MQIKLLMLDSSGYTLEQQLRKISEEHHEVLTALAVDLACELIDLMQACKTCLEMLEHECYTGYIAEQNEQHIAKLRQRAAEGRIKLIEEGV